MPITGAETGCSATRLTTGRLTLETLQPGQAAALAASADPQGGIARDLLAPPLGQTLAIARRDEGDTIGLLRLQPGPGAAARLDFWLAKPFRCQGYLAEAIRRLLRYAFENQGLAAVSAATAPQHTGDNFLAKIGLRPQDDGGFAITRQQWLTEQAPPSVLVSAAALIDADSRILLTQRPAGKEMAGLWEFPGGKVEPGETPEAALIRELREELGVDTVESCLAPLAFASHHYENFHLLMPLFACRVWQGTPRPREGQKLAWVRIEKLRQYPMPPADEPLVALLRDFL